jgi:hypothetical protein
MESQALKNHNNPGRKGRSRLGEVRVATPFVMRYQGQRQKW